jgi:hypothetical protein
VPSGAINTPVMFASRFREARNQTDSNRVDVAQKNDRDRRRCRLGRLSRHGADGEDHIDLGLHKLSRQHGKPLEFPVGISALDDEVPALDVPSSRSGTQK